MKINRPFVMLALVGSKEDAQTNTHPLLADWKIVAGKKGLKKLNKKVQVEISKTERINQKCNACLRQSHGKEKE